MDKKIFVGAQVDFETIDEKIQRFMRAREEFGQAAYELKQAVYDSMFRFEFRGSPFPDQDKAK